MRRLAGRRPRNASSYQTHKALRTASHSKEACTLGPSITNQYFPLLLVLLLILVSLLSKSVFFPVSFRPYGSELCSRDDPLSAHNFDGKSLEVVRLAEKRSLECKSGSPRPPQTGDDPKFSQQEVLSLYIMEF